MKKLFSLAALSIVMFSSCKKDTPAATCNLDNNGILGDYKITSILYKADAATPEMDVFTTYSACEKDDIYTFSPNGIYVVTEGVTSCTPTNATSGTWSLSGTTLTLDGSDVSTVTNFSCGGFVINQSNVTTGESTKVTMVKQ